MSKKVINQTNEVIMEDLDNEKYYVNIDGEDVEVECDSDSAYSCLLNCLEGYYFFNEDEEYEEEDDEDVEG